ncbi:glycoside hydrolase [Streptomyces mashuensis]|uniref:Glycoside hydrolase n=1 Tax=Streptomyces mashuensis TaxID=33904 RepID=A0A919ED72_9ACTN|nr:C40 family peptidase [Streptomyces mashuensis]GHF45648.1 glycoside hydrolase [Streptomyces mashuensis]
MGSAVGSADREGDGRGGGWRGVTGGAPGEVPPGAYGAYGSYGRRGRAAGVVAVVCAAGLVGALWAPGAAWADPAPPAPGGGSGAQSLEQVRKEIDSLYRKAEAATDSYNAANEEQRLQEKNVSDLGRRLGEAQQRMDRLRRDTGALARAQYRSGGLTPRTQLVLSSSPDTFLDGVRLARKGEQATHTLLTQVETTRADLEKYTKEAKQRWKALDAERKRKEEAKKEVEARLAAAKKVEEGLAERERARLKELEDERARSSQAAWLSTDAGKGALGAGAATGAARRVVEYAVAQLGKNYVWGAQGPDTFDCSGLTLQAWAAGGRAIPRTSQEQWRQLPKVDVKDMRPGDLVIYFSDASHVGLYVGNGTIVHAPRPGRQVTYAGAGTMPILGVVRPG